MNRDEIQKEALKQALLHNQCTLALATGVGKTKVGLMHMESQYTSIKQFLVVAPKLSIIESWKSEAEKFDKQHLLENVTFTTYLSLNKQDPKNYDVVYLDECHSLKDSHRSFLNAYTGKILGLTGTPPRYASSEKGRLVNQFCPVAYEYLTDNAIDDDILNDYKIIVHQINLGTEKNFKVSTKTGGFITSERANYGYWCNRLDNAITPKQVQMARVMRMKAMQEYVTKEKYTSLLAGSIKSKCIIFANTQDQADKLCKHSYHSNNSESDANLELFKSGQIDKLSCVLQLSEGVNIPELEQGIIMHSYGNERKSSQRIGRLLRLNPDQTAIVHILCYVNTVDEKWVKDALSGFDQSKIEWKDFKVKLD